MLTFHGKNRQLTCSYGRQLKWIAREKHLPNRSRPYNKICPHRWKEKNKCTGIICWLRCCKLKDTTGQGLAEKLIEVIEKNFGWEEDSERHPSFNPGEKNLEAIFISLLQPQPQSSFMWFSIFKQRMFNLLWHSSEIAYNLLLVCQKMGHSEIICGNYIEATEWHQVGGKTRFC